MLHLQQDEEEIRTGREAAERLSQEWPKVDGFPPLKSEAAARAAIEYLGDLMVSDRPLFRASRRGAERGAESLSARPFQGVLEVLQNADDLGARELRLAIRIRGSRRELLIVHDGDRVLLGHVGAMVLPWVTTKNEDPNASGRWGIGQMTLRALGGPIELHCAPYHFRMEPDRPHWCRTVSAIDGFYSPERQETLLLVPLLPEVEPEALTTFISELGSQALLFLNQVGRLYLFDLSTGPVIDHRLIPINSTEIPLHLFSTTLVVKQTELSDPRSRRRYTRYLVERPLNKGQRRHHKETGGTTTLGIAFSHQHGERGGFYDRLPLPLSSGFPFSLNAQFDPDAGRSTILENAWNAHRLSDLGEFIAATALDAFDRDTAHGWWTVPLAGEIPEETSPWIAEKLRECVLKPAQARIATNLCISANDSAHSLERLCYEEAALDGLLTTQDQEILIDGYHALLPEQRDDEGRWRSVLSELDQSHLIEVQVALDLFDQDDEFLADRAPQWYVAMARAAIEADLLEEFLHKRGVLLADGSRVEPPGHKEPRSLVCRVAPTSLAAALSLALQIHSVYMTDEADARLFVETLKQVSVLIVDANSDETALAILSRDGVGVRVRLNDQQLLALRDTFDRLDDVHRNKFGSAIGANIELRAFTFTEEGKVEEQWRPPIEAYLSAPIDHETNSFAKAAAKTPGLVWLDGSYAKLLKRVERRELGAQRFLVRLGARNAPRLKVPANEWAPWKRDTRPASLISDRPRPDLQRLELRALSTLATHLLRDRWSPDLDAVIGDIQADPNTSKRRRRAIALLSNLARAWERTYADYERAEVVYASDGYWHKLGEVTATWLARAASEPWLPNANGRLCAPRELCLPTEANKLVYGNQRGVFLASVDKLLHRSPVLAALRLRQGPPASSLVKRLQELRDGPQVSGIEPEARTAYHLLALACPGSDARGRPIDDMTVNQLRASFAGGRGTAGLLLVNGKWCAPNEVFSGPNIFGKYGRFVPSQPPQLTSLWRVLELQEPGARDCVDVLRRLANTPLGTEETGILLETLRHLAKHLDDLSPAARAHLRRLPLWNGERWLSTRPLYTVEDSALADSLACRLNLWRPGFTSFAGLEALIEILGVTLLRPEDFIPGALESKGAIEGEEVRRQFALAVEHLRDELLRSDRDLYDSLDCSWKEFGASQIIISPDLELAVTPPDHRRVSVPAKAHMLRRPLTLIVRNSEEAGTEEAGGRAIGSLFKGDRQKAAWAWVSMWKRAGDGLTPERLVLGTDADEEKGLGGNSLVRLKDQANRRRTRRGGNHPKGDTRSASEVQPTLVRRLKDISRFEPDEGTHINKHTPIGGIIFPSRKPLAPPPAGGQGTRPGGYKDTRNTIRTVLPPLDDRERLALDAVRLALRADPNQIADLRARRGIGADAIDDLGQFYEIKMESGAEVPDTITLTRAEVDRAQSDSDFFLAVVSGLEELGRGELRVRFIFDPLKRLSVRIKGEVTLSGVRQAEALEFVFKKKD